MPVRFVLTMIVKNEGNTIGRCLDAALPHCSAYVICDTGSTDNTRMLIYDAGARHNVTGLIVDDVWKNFGHNRTRSAEAARRFVRDVGFPEKETYLLFLDADMELEVAPGFDKNTLTAASYNLIQVQPGMEYENTRLGRADIEWVSAGATHEFWVPRDHALGPLLREGIRIIDHNDGGAKADKFERDAALLEEGLRAEPKNERYMFYLAQTYFDLGRYRDAIELYKKRRAAGGYHTGELWYSHFRQGMALLRLEDPSGPDELLRAYNANPRRAEPLFYLAQYYRERGQNHAAMLLTEQVSKLPLPDVSEFFLEPALYGGAPLQEENAINAWHVGRPDLGMKEADALARVRGRPHDSYEQAARHLGHYAEPLKHVSSGRFVVPEGIRRGFSNSSPTVVQSGGRLFVHCRLLNYHHERGCVFQSRDPDGIIKTRGAAASFRPGEEPSGWKEVVTKFPEDWSEQGIRVHGAEDQRWVLHDGRVYVVANTWQTPMKRDWPQMVLGRLDSGAHEQSVAAISSWWPLPSPYGRDTEKNWLPWSRDGELFFVYGYDPFEVVHFNFKTGAVQKALEYVTPFAAHRLRGSAGPVPHPEKPGHTLIMVHEKAMYPDEHVYMQRMIELDGALRPLALSRPFFIDHRGVEFPLGFIDYEGKALITYGREERESAWALVEWQEILARFP